MKDTRKTLLGLVVAASLGLGSAIGYAQAVITPFSPSEVAPAASEQEEAELANTMGAGSEECVTPYSPNECGPSEAPMGGTAAPALGGSLENLPQTPGYNWEANTIDD